MPSLNSAGRAQISVQLLPEIFADILAMLSGHADRLPDLLRDMVLIAPVVLRETVLHGPRHEHSCIAIKFTEDEIDVLIELLPDDHAMQETLAKAKGMAVTYEAVKDLQDPEEG